jgi:hypothetical protein
MVFLPLNSTIGRSDGSLCKAPGNALHLEILPHQRQGQAVAFAQEQTGRPDLQFDCIALAGLELQRCASNAIT